MATPILNQLDDGLDLGLVILLYGGSVGIAWHMQGAPLGNFGGGLGEQVLLFGVFDRRI